MATTMEYIDINGTRVPIIFENDNRLPLVNMQFAFTNSGSITDTKKAGLAKLSAKLMNQGTKELGSSKFADSLESKAIQVSAATGVETFVIEVGSLKEQFDEALGNLEALLKDPNYTQETVDKIKTMTIGALSSKENNFDYVADNELKSILFKGTVLAQASAGTTKTVNSIELKDIQGFVNKHLTQSNLIVVLGGDIDYEDAKKKISQVIQTLPLGEVMSIKHYSTVTKPTQSIIKKDTEQAYVYFGSPYNMTVDSEDYYKARVATFILGTGGFGSRLMEEIRVKRGLAYSAYATVNISNSSSYLSGYLQTKLESLDEAKKSVNKVFEEFIKKGVTQEELDQTKKFILGSEPLRVETMSQRLNRTFMEHYKGFTIGQTEHELKMIKKLQLKDLNQFIKEHKEILDLSFAIVTK
jgi:zinc protease